MRIPLIRHDDAPKLHRAVGGVLAIVVLLACDADAHPRLDAGSDGSAAVPARTRSGARLRARVYAIEGGAEIFAGWRDTELGVDCAFAIAADGALRCLPESLPMSETSFADPECSVAVVDAQGACVLPEFVRQSRAAPGCPTWSYGSRRTSILRRGAEVPLPGALYERAPDGSCTVRSPAPSGRVFELGPEIPAADFVAATIESAPAPTPIAPRVLEASDGATTAWGFVDTRTGRPCSVERAEDGQLRCIPEADASLAYFSDATCETPLAYGTTCETPHHAWQPDYRECGRPIAVRAIEGVAAGVVHDRSCEPIDPPVTMYSTVPVDPRSLVEAEVVDGVVRGRLRERVALLEGGLRQHLGWYDTELGVECSPRVAADGDLRCVPDEPVGWLSDVAFADAECRERLVIPNGPCPVRYAWDVDDGVCPWRYGIYEIGAPHAGPSYVSLRPGACTSPARTDGLHSRGPRVDPATLLAVTEELR